MQGVFRRSFFLPSFSADAGILRDKAVCYVNKTREAKLMKKNAILRILLTVILTIPCLQAHSQATYQQEQERQQREQQERQAEQQRQEQQREQQERQAQQQQERQAQQQQEQQERQAQQQQEQQERQAQQQQEQQERQAQQQQERQAQQQQEQQERQAQQQQEQQKRQAQQQQEARQAAQNHEHEGEQKRTPEPSHPVSPFPDFSIPGTTGGGLVTAPAVRPDSGVTPPAPAIGLIPGPLFQQPANTATINMLMNALAAPAMQPNTLGAQATAANQQNLMFQSLLASQAQQQQQLNSGIDQILMTIIENTSDPALASALANQIGQTDPIQQALTDQLNALGSISQTTSKQKSSLAANAGTCSAACGQDLGVLSFQADCTTGNFASCYRAAAALCQCNINKGGCGNNAQALQSCVASNTNSADSLMGGYTIVVGTQSTAPPANGNPSPPPPTNPCAGAAAGQVCAGALRN
jgi:hypothetical protein